MRRCCDIMSLALQALPRDEKAGKTHWRQVRSAWRGLPPATHWAKARKRHLLETAQTGPCWLLMLLPCPPAHSHQAAVLLISLDVPSVMQMAKEDDSALHSWLRWLDRLLVHLLFNVVW